MVFLLVSLPFHFSRASASVSALFSTVYISVGLALVHAQCCQLTWKKTMFLFFHFFFVFGSCIFSVLFLMDVRERERDNRKKEDSLFSTSKGLDGTVQS